MCPAFGCGRVTISCHSVLCGFTVGCLTTASISCADACAPGLIEYEPRGTFATVERGYNGRTLRHYVRDSAWQSRLSTSNALTLHHASSFAHCKHWGLLDHFFYDANDSNTTGTCNWHCERPESLGNSFETQELPPTVGAACAARRSRRGPLARHCRAGRTVDSRLARAASWAAAPAARSAGSHGDQHAPPGNRRCAPWGPAPGGQRPSAAAAAAGRGCHRGHLQQRRQATSAAGRGARPAAAA